MAMGASRYRKVFSAIILLGCGLENSYAASDMSTSFYSANEIYAQCDSARGSNASYMCLGYVTGIIDILSELKQVCTPPQVTVEQAKDVALKYLRDNPKDRAYTASSEIYLALTEAFPCH